MRVATAWLSGCSGCHMSLLDMDERLLELASRIELMASPLTDWKEFPETDVTLVEGAVGNVEQLELIRLIRSRSRLLVSLGDCAITGNVPAMRNVYPVEELLRESYETHSGPVIGVPGRGSAVPRLIDRVLQVHQVVEVDYFLPGCPPDAGAIYELLAALCEGRQPALETRRFG
ncbi:MAG: NADP oxidoreductase [Bryobacteraceae bacterium]|nr:NADP oxidoreductase [Bryobacteraceae bacterium]